MNIAYLKQIEKDMAEIIYMVNNNSKKVCVKRFKYQSCKFRLDT